MWSDLCGYGEWQCNEPRHWLCPSSNAFHQFMLVGGGAISVCLSCGKTEDWLAKQLNERLNGRNE